MWMEQPLQKHLNGTTTDANGANKGFDFPVLRKPRFGEHGMLSPKPLLKRSANSLRHLSLLCMVRLTAGADHVPIVRI